MEFKDLFREKYRRALLAARANDLNGVLAGLADLYALFAAQYSSDNGDSIVVKAKLSYWQDIFGGYIGIIRQYGLKDRRVQKFFGLIDDTSIPSFGDIMSGKGSVSPPSDINPISGVDIAGIVPPAEVVETPILVKPVLPIESVTPIVSDQPTEPDLPVNSIGGGAIGGIDAPVYSPDTLEGFIGQQHIVKVLLKEIAIAKNKGLKYLDNILLFGNPGLGKSTLMELLAKALGVKYEWMDCSQYRNSQQSLKALQSFLMRIARENVPVVIALDEIHMLTAELQSSLLTLLNSRVWVSPPDVNGNIKRIPIENFTFIAATTDDDKVLNTIKDRCLRLKFQMVDYTPDELRRIYKNKVASKGLTITDEAIDTCIPRSRGSIRYVNSFVDGLDKALHNDSGVRISTDIDKTVALKYFEEKGIDAIGLENKDLEILKAIGEDTTGAIGIDSLSARVGLDPKKYQSEYEPYLIKIGFVTVTGRGRCLTEKAIKYLREENH